jgi:DNA replication protein DnaC
MKNINTSNIKKMNAQATLQLMQKMKLNGMSTSYESILDLPIDSTPDTHSCIATLIDAELQNRAHKRTSMLLRLSKLRYPASIHDITYQSDRNLDKQTIAQLSDSTYIERSENILITGATGCGKSFLTCALGHQACLLGHRTLYFNMNRLCEQIAVAKVDGTYIKWINRISKASLVIFDDFGLQPLSHDIKLAILQILEDRYQKGSTIIASQLPVNKWYDYLDEPTLADAIMDRLTAKSSKIDLKGKSLRHH